MTETITIPFLKRFRTPMLNGTKTITSRTRKYGEQGDYFTAFYATFKIYSVETHPFATITEQWQAEGCSSKEDFLEVWKKIHPHKKFEDDTPLFIHKFHRIK